jgi:hypothetical protein
MTSIAAAVLHMLMFLEEDVFSDAMDCVDSQADGLSTLRVRNG